MNRATHMHTLVIDDDASLRPVLRDLLVEVGYRRVSFVSHWEPLIKPTIDPERVDLVILDDLQARDTYEVRRRVTSAFPRVPVVAIADGNYEAMLEASFEILSVTRRRRSDRERSQNERMRRLEESNHELLRATCVDALTGIANRSHFDTLLAAQWLRGASRGWSLSVVMLDLDFFHAFNEHYGHPGGDACLRRVADALTRCLRRPADIVARYGGEEFVALLPDTDAAGGRVAAERLRARVEALALPHVGSRCSTVVTASVGVATALPRRDRSARSLIAAADRALLRAKMRGRNRLCVDGSQVGVVVVRPPTRQPGPIAVAHPILADRVPAFLARKRGEVATALAEGDVATHAAISRDLQRTGAKLGFGDLVVLGERLEEAIHAGACERGREVLSELSAYLENVQVVYRHPATVAPELSEETCKRGHGLRLS